jgi:hypothetical protein
MPVHAARMLPGSEQIATNMPQLMAAFDPAKPLTFQVRVVGENKQQQQQQQRLVNNMPQLMAAFDPAKPCTFQVPTV